ncbi:hypothetical protein CYMTET_55718 [Cymbomonas tetramitiformis]|uniref:Uncharacterized protein n=1 Tax=Cymbomonas tetramitiformis TaxID=36881 RepID=A0AAE0BCF5_9CHLO|nr:hypothetical protein CYMTET_55718 [Cymbomonas tetramitiformis]
MEVMDISGVPRELSDESEDEIREQPAPPAAEENLARNGVPAVRDIVTTKFQTDEQRKVVLGQVQLDKPFLTKWVAEGGIEKAWEECAAQIMTQEPYSSYNTADKKRMEFKGKYLRKQIGILRAGFKKYQAAAPRRSGDDEEFDDVEQLLFEIDTKWTEIETVATQAAANEAAKKRLEKEEGEAARQQAHDTFARRQKKKKAKRGRRSNVGSSTGSGAGAPNIVDDEEVIGLSESEEDEAHGDPLASLGMFLKSEARAKQRKIDLDEQRLALEERRFEEEKLDAAAKREESKSTSALLLALAQKMVG